MMVALYEEDDLDDQVRQLSTALGTLIAQLQKSRNESAQFFIDKTAELRAAGDVREALEQLSTCRAMAQYGNFSYTEESQLEGVVDAADACLAALPKP
ncbi:MULTISPECIES: hypothetical protein [unclassified Pseudomonas]|uniref:hypothetical protein n=1 Tax=unclassified Pseudomonas TaxID=196821 RepID=UPI00128E3B3D|nr:MULTISPECIES: hypothetical protein [unclassified Pseudomonas]MPQ65267.1 hypothetical protein [Pseudomonas sp. MWU12-2323]